MRKLRLPSNRDARLAIVWLGLFVVLAVAVVSASTFDSPTIKAISFAFGLGAILAMGWAGNEFDRLVRMAVRQGRAIRRVASSTKGSASRGPFIESRSRLRRRQAIEITRLSIPLAIIGLYVWFHFIKHAI